jgi:hypothetical protein
MAGTLTVFTTTLTNGTLTISASDNVQKLSVICRQGTIGFIGNAKFKNAASTLVNFSVGQGTTIVSGTVATPIDGITITAGTSGDIASIEISYQ